MPTFHFDYSTLDRSTPAPVTPLPTITPGGAGSVSFTEEIQPLLTTYCVRCHGGIAELWLTDFEHVMVGTPGGPIVVPGDPEQSRLYDYVRQGLMPPDAPNLPAPDVDRLRRWILEGAVKN